MGLAGVAIYYLTSNLISLAMFGYYVSLAWKCALIFHEKAKTQSFHKSHLLCFLILSTLFTVKIIIDSVVLVNSFTNPLEDGSIEIPSFDRPLVLAINAVWVIETVIADLFIIYRVYILWSREIRFTILPTLLLLAGVGDGIYLLFLMSRFSSSDPSAFFATLKTASNTFVSLTLSLNVICSSLIAYRLWVVRRAVSQTRLSTRRDPLKRIGNIILESAAVYTAMLVACLVANATGSLLAYFFFALLHPVIGVVFVSIIVRSTAGVSWGEASIRTITAMSMEATSTANRTTRSVYEFPPHELSSGKNLEPLPGQEIQVKMDKTVTTKVDSQDPSFHL